MKTYLLICFTVISFALTSQEDALDFWIGDWEVSWYDSDSNLIVGSNLIESTLDGKVIQENFRDPSSDFKGVSISVYDPRLEQWHQAWADNQGGYYDFIGIMEEDKKIFQTAHATKSHMIFRMRFDEITENSFLWFWEGKKVDSNDWKLLWKISYNRK